MRSYTTQIDAARKGIVTPEIRAVAAQEQVAVSWLMARVAKGQVVIPANKLHMALKPQGIGDGLRVKVNVNLGISKDQSDFEREFKKVDMAIQMGAHAIMDLSSFGKTEAFRRALVDRSPAMVGTVPIYDALGFYEKALETITADEFFDVVERHCKDGVDFLTIHAGLNLETSGVFERNKRVTHIVSRGGSLLYAWMKLTGFENPFYEQFDRLLDLCERYDVTLSLGDAMRPGCLSDATDASQIKELITLGELTKRAWERNVQVMVEGPGHMSLGEIAANMVIQKRLCHGAPFYVLGPIVTDIAPGYDHITSAIGGAQAALHGANFLCYVTPAEHLRLPTIEDMKEGIIAAQIAAHVADLALGLPGARDWDDEMSVARQKLDWEAMFDLAIDPEKARRFRRESKPEHDDSCTMCGKMCSMRNMNRMLAGKTIALK